MDGDPQASQERRSSACLFVSQLRPKIPSQVFLETDKKEGAAEDVYAEERWRMKMYLFVVIIIIFYLYASPQHVKLAANVVFTYGR